MSRSSIYLFLVGLIGFFSSCRKDKFNSLLQPSGTEVSANSSIRVFNFFNLNMDVTINNIPLTNYGQGVQYGTQQGLALFPTGSWVALSNGNPFFIPSSMITKDRKAHIKVSLASGQAQFGSVTNFSFTSVDTVLTDDPLNPNDYYALPNGHLMVVPRNTQAPVQPDHFKIRVINLSDSSDPNNVYGRVKLTYSDGSSVDPRLDTVGAGSISPYVDLPYGAYMFKLFARSGDFSKQLTEVPSLPTIDICDAIGSNPIPQQGLFPRVLTFKPGATYSLVITKNAGLFSPCPNGLPYPVEVLYNGYRVVTEQSPGPNVTYAQLDAFNALPVNAVTVKVDGYPLGGTLPYTGHTDYGIFVQGTHQVQAFDASGTVLVSKSITLSPYDNYTAWVYESPSGHPDICFANTDMTSTLYLTDADGNVFTENTSGGTINVPPVDDGTDGTIRVKSILYAWQTRFLNLTPDLPYATFTNDASPFPSVGYPNAGDSSNFAAASVNMQPGVTPDYNPFVLYPFGVQVYGTGTPTYGYEGYYGNSPTPPSVIRVFQSSPGPPSLVPGTLLNSITALPREAYISNLKLYPVASYTPVTEDGIYTTALIGRVNASPSDQSRAQLVILKHNK